MFQNIIAMTLIATLIWVFWFGYNTRKKFPELKTWTGNILLFYGGTICALILFAVIVNPPGGMLLLEKFTSSMVTVLFFLLSGFVLVCMTEKRLQRT